MLREGSGHTPSYQAAASGDRACSRTVRDMRDSSVYKRAKMPIDVLRLSRG